MIKKILVLFSFLFVLTNLFAEEDIISTARQLVENRDYYKALMEYTKILKKEKDNCLLFYERGNVKYELNNYSGAIGDYTSSLEIEVSSQVYIARGKAELLNGQTDDAIEDFNEALDIEESAYVYALMTDANFQKENYVDAIDNYTKAIELFPSAYFYINRGILYQKIKDYDNALQDYTSAIELDEDNIEYYTLRYELYNIIKQFDLAEEDKSVIDEINGNYEAAIQKLSGILNKKQDYLIHYYIGLLKNDIKDYTGAINSFTSSIELKKTPEAFLERGKSKANIRKYNGALADFDKSLKLNRSSEAYFEIAKIYSLLKKYEQAIEFYNKAFKFDRNNIDIIIGRLETLYYLGKYKDVILETVKVMPSFDDVRLVDLLAKSEYKIGMYKEALKDLEESLNAFQRMETYLLIAEIYEEIKEYKKAILNYSILIENEKEKPGFLAKQNLKKFYSKRKNLYMLIDRPDLAQADKGYFDALVGSYQNNIAIDDFTKSLEIKPNAEVYIARGNLKLQNQDYEEAIEDFYKALEIKPSSLAYLCIGQAQMQMDNDEKALENFNNALKFDNKKDEIFYFIAKLMEKKDDIENAIIYYTKALDIKEKRIYYLGRSKLYEKILKNDLAIADKGNIKLLFNNYKEAIEDYTKSLEIYENAFVFAQRGKAEEQIGKYEEALNDYIKAIELDKNGHFIQLKNNLLAKLSEEQKTILDLKQFEKKLFPE